MQETTSAQRAAAVVARVRANWADTPEVEKPLTRQQRRWAGRRFAKLQRSRGKILARKARRRGQK